MTAVIIFISAQRMLNFAIGMLLTRKNHVGKLIVWDFIFVRDLSAIKMAVILKVAKVITISMMNTSKG